MLTLSRGGNSLVVTPEQGGAIAAWSRNSVALLRSSSPISASRGDPGAMGCFPLVPYCNRIAHRRFNWGGQLYDLAPNFGDHPHTIHGVGWKRPWSVREESEDAVSLSLHHDPDLDWPFAFGATLAYRLTDAGVTIQMAATNRHDGPAPMGLGAHPYFPRASGATLTFSAAAVWLNRDSLPDRHIATPPDRHHANGRPVNAEPLDNCFTGWSGTADLPALRITADRIFSNLQVFTPAGADFFCVEPVSHVPDAINRLGLSGDQSMTILQPGETIAGTILLSPETPCR